jgi:hypothetical protein
LHSPRGAGGVDPLFHRLDRGFGENRVPAQQLNGLYVSLRRNRNDQAHGSANQQPLQRLQVFGFDTSDKLSLEIGSRLRHGEHLHSRRGRVVAHVSDGAFGPRLVTDDLGIGVQKLRYTASTGEDQRALVGAQIVIALAQVLPEESFVNGPAFGQCGPDVEPSLSDRRSCRKTLLSSATVIESARTLALA